LAYSPNGRRLAGASRDAIKLWDTETGVEVLTLRGAPQRFHDPPFNARVVFHPDGTRLVGTNWDESISVWDAPPIRDENDMRDRYLARRQAAEGRALLWHLQEAEHCVEHKSLNAAQFHLERLRNKALSLPLRERAESCARKVKELQQAQAKTRER
jgi:WD40 repeat protein